MNNPERRVGVWLIGACGGVGSTVALGLAALAQNLTTSIGLVTDLPQFSTVSFDDANRFVVGGHDIRNATFLSSIRELHTRSSVVSERMIMDCQPRLEQWSENVRPGIILHSGPAIESMADRAGVNISRTPREAIAQIQADLHDFREQHRLDQVAVLNVASTEAPMPRLEQLQDLHQLKKALDGGADFSLPTSSMYAYAALDAGFPYVNLTPSTGSDLPALNDLAIQRAVPHAGQDLKTGETMLKSVLAPMFAKRNLRVLSWVGHNILGNRDGQVLADPSNKSSKINTKDALLQELLGYKPQSHISIEYIESLDDWKTAWDHIHFEGFLGTKMTLQFTWQGCDSILAAPLAIDLARLILLAQRRGDRGLLPSLGVFFKKPLGTPDHDFSRQFDQLSAYLLRT